MREKLMTLPLTELKAIAKSQGMKGISTLRKNELIELLCEKAKELENASAQATQQKRTAAKQEAVLEATPADTKESASLSGGVVNGGPSDSGSGDAGVFAVRRTASVSPAPALICGRRISWGRNFPMRRSFFMQAV